jgi:hypothetical protein
VEEIMGEVLPRVTEQKVFSTLLRERLTESKKSPGSRLSEELDYPNRLRDKEKAAKGKAAATANSKEAETKRKAELVVSQAKRDKFMAKYKKTEEPKLKGTRFAYSAADRRAPSQPLNTSTELFRGVRARLAEAGAGKGSTAEDRAKSREEAGERRKQARANRTAPPRFDKNGEIVPPREQPAPNPAPKPAESLFGPNSNPAGGRSSRPARSVKSAMRRTAGVLARRQPNGA